MVFRKINVLYQIVLIEDFKKDTASYLDIKQARNFKVIKVVSFYIKIITIVTKLLIMKWLMRKT